MVGVHVLYYIYRIYKEKGKIEFKKSFAQKNARLQIQ